MDADVNCSKWTLNPAVVGSSPTGPTTMIFCLVGLLGFSAVFLGAVGTHVLNLGEGQHSFEVATRYQLIHALLLLYFAHQLEKRTCWSYRAGACLILLGCVFFCGGIYAKAFTGNPMWVSLAPMGGISFMCAWLCICIRNKC